MSVNEGHSGNRIMRWTSRYSLTKLRRNPSVGTDDASRSTKQRLDLSSIGWSSKAKCFEERSLICRNVKRRGDIRYNKTLEEDGVKFEATVMSLGGQEEIQCQSNKLTGTNELKDYLSKLLSLLSYKYDLIRVVFSVLAYSMKSAAVQCLNCWSPH